MKEERYNSEEMMTEDHEGKNVEDIIDGGNGLFGDDLDGAIEEVDFGMDKFDNLYDGLEDNGGGMPENISDAELAEIEEEIQEEVSKLADSENMARVLEILRRETNG